MNDKIAICFSGQIRTGCEVSANILRYIGDMRHQCDIFVHTWDVNSLGSAYAPRIKEDPMSQKFTDVTQVPENVFKNFYDIYSPVKMVVEKYDSQPYIPYKRFSPEHGCFLSSMWLSIYKSNKLKQDHGEKYRYTVRIRPDTLFSPTKSLKDDLLQCEDNMVIYSDPIYKGTNSLFDFFWISQSNVMDTLCEFYSKTYGEGPEHEAKYWLQYHGISIKPLDNSIMRTFNKADIDQNIDPMNPIFGNPPGTANI
jgi:hypothetical protein